MRRLIANRRPFRIVIPFFVLYVVAQLLLRFALLWREWDEIDVGAGRILASLGVGFLFDLVISIYGITVIFLIRLLVPKSWRHRKPDRLLMSVITAVVAISALVAFVGDYLFWDDIGARINFLALDYLYYPEEVVGFLYSSYPVHVIIPLALVVVFFLCSLAYRYVVPRDPDPRSRPIRWIHAGIATSLSCLALLFVDQSLAEVSVNHYVNEVAKNGLYSFFDAAIYYDRPYLENFPVQPRADVAKRLREQLDGPHITFLSKDPWETTRLIQPPGPEKRYNVIVVVMESMSAEYMATFGNQLGLTPNLDRLATESLFFANHYSSGMRTVRGVEAVTLAAPPTPGPAIVKRPNNENLATLGWVFRDRGYDTRFAYNGYARFDSMEGFVKGNGYDVLDRRNFSADEIHFENSWGVSDEDIFLKAISEADRSHAKNQPFSYTILSISNHRPFTYPDNTITCPPGLPERLAAVKYADYAIGRLIQEARQHPWFDDTVFVFVADHAAISTGKREITLEKFRTPLIFYAPKILPAERNEKICCQIDLVPTLLGILNFHYYSRFYGNDVRTTPHQRALLADFEKLGYYDGKELIVLRPDGTARSYNSEGDYLGLANPQALLDAACYYQHAADWRHNNQRIATVVEPQSQIQVTEIR